MSESESAEGLDAQSYPELMNVARSANEQFEEVEIDTDGPTKDELVEDMEDAGVEVEDGEYTLDGEEIERLESNPSSGSSGSSAPSDKTVLYVHERAATTDEHLEEIFGAVEELGYEVEESESKFDTHLIIEPAPEVEEVEEDDEDAEEDDESEESEESDESDEEQAESDSEDEEEESDESDEESDESDSESDEEESEDDAEEESEEDDSEEDSEDEDDAAISASVYQERLEDKTKQDVYQIASDLDIDGRSEMDKDELVEAVVEAKVEDEDEPVVADD